MVKSKFLVEEFKKVFTGGVVVNILLTTIRFGYSLTNIYRFLLLDNNRNFH